MDAEALGKKILAVDPAFLWVVVLNAKGEALARVYSEKYVSRDRLREQTKAKFGILDAIFLGAASQAEEWYGKMDFILLSYQETKMMLMYNKKHELHFATKIALSANAEDLYLKVKPVLSRA
ncbi:MAG: hypothetical protein OK454_03690 [Thaumarchaeota archaeon]|nr:hypothetical protein [Nitrososphaerota archaeon]